jgi:hypothetical protein
MESVLVAHCCGAGWFAGDDMQMVSHVCLVQGSACYGALFGGVLGTCAF